MAYNEAASIGAVIDAFQRQSTEHLDIAEIVVVASGCTDTTVAIVDRIATSDSRIRLIEEEHRSGKSTAINAFLREARSELCCLSSADTIPSSNFIELVGRALASDPKVGMAGGQIIPADPQQGAAARMNHALWRFHHQVALHRPKLGEIVMLRRSLAGMLPVGVGCDEVAAESLICGSGGELAYVPSALVWNRGPTKVRELFRQRLRNHVLHLVAREELHYTPATYAARDIVRPVLRTILRDSRPAAALGMACLEITARAKARVEHRRGATYRLWEPAESARTASWLGLEAQPMTPD